jgi:hypothetical protein
MTLMLFYKPLDAPRRISSQFPIVIYNYAHNIQDILVCFFIFAMNEPIDPLEILWDSLLSREPERVRSAYRELSEAEQTAVAAHLQRMAAEEGWHPEQRASALAALQALAALS